MYATAFEGLIGYLYLSKQNKRLDEILKFCDGTAELNIIDLIVKELDTLDSIYMISHREIPIGYDNQLLVVKDSKGLSKLE